MTTRTLLHGLNEEESAIAVWKLLFSPQLRNHFGSDWSREWTNKLIENLGDQAAFSDQYSNLFPDVRAALTAYPRYSMANPPWSMASLDMRLGMIPWVTLDFDRPLAMLLSEGSAFEKHFGEVAPFAFILKGGPGDSQETAFRVCAPANPVRASAEHWLMRAYLWRREEGFHATCSDEEGRTFSVHGYTDEHGVRKRIFFDTTNSFGHAQDDFREFLSDGELGTA